MTLKPSQNGISKAGREVSRTGGREREMESERRNVRGNERKVEIEFNILTNEFTHSSHSNISLCSLLDNG